MSLEEFFESLLKNYLKFRDTSPYVLIPDLRKAVCQELGITSEEFDRRLIQLIKRRQFGDWLIETANIMLTITRLKEAEEK